MNFQTMKNTFLLLFASLIPAFMIAQKLEQINQNGTFRTVEKQNGDFYIVGKKLLNDSGNENNLDLTNLYSSSSSEFIPFSSGKNISTLDSIDPGVEPEADLPYKIKYTPDGQKIVVMYHHSNNVFVYDAASHEVLEIIEVGAGPEDMEVTNQRVYLCCYHSAEVYVINLNNYSIENSFAVEPQPCIIKVNTFQTLVYLGFHAGYHKGSNIAAYNLATHQQQFSTTVPYIDQINMSEGRIGRMIHNYSGFLLVDNDQKIACLKSGGKYVLLLDASNGDLLKQFYFHAFSLAKTPDGDTLYSAGVSEFNTRVDFYRIDPESMDVTDSIIINTSTLPIPWRWQDNLCIGGNGKRLFVEMESMGWGTLGFLANFEDNSYQVFETEFLDPCYFPDVSHDGRYVLMEESTRRIFDFEQQEYISSSFVGFIAVHCKILEASPVSSEYVFHDNMAGVLWGSYMRGEYLQFVDYSDTANVFVSDSVLCGSSPEADLIYDAVYSNKHDKIISAHPLSGNIAIIDGTTHETDTLIDVPLINSVKIVADDYITLSAYDNEYVHLFNLNTMSIVKSFYLGYDPYHADVIPSSDKQFFYTYNRASDMLKKYELDGSNTLMVDSLYIEDSFVHFLDWDSWYFPEITPDGKYIIFNYSGTYSVVSTETRLEVVATFSASGDLFDMAFSDDSKWLCLSHGLGNEFCSIIHLDGANTKLEHIVDTEGTGSLAVAYNPVDNTFFVGRKSDVYIIEPENGTIQGMFDLMAKNYIVQVGVDPAGLPIAMTLSYLYYNDEEHRLWHPARRFTIDEHKQHCIIPGPGPDRVYIMDFLSTGVEELTKEEGTNIRVFPNPASSHINIQSDETIEQFRIYSLQGQVVFSSQADSKEYRLSSDLLPAGIYVAEVYCGDRWSRQKVVVCD